MSGAVITASGIDSAFSIVEGVSTAISDKFGTNKKKTTIGVCIVSPVGSFRRWF